MTNSRFNVSHSALTGGELPGFRTARARSAFYSVPGFCTIIGTFVTATPGHVTPWTRCYRCLRPSIVSTMMTSFRIDSSDFPSLGFLSQRLYHPRVWNGNVPGKRQPIASDYRPTGRFVLLQAAIVRFFVARRRSTFLLTVPCGRSEDIQ